MLEAIVAVYSDWGIGANGTQPVVLRADRKHFQEITAGATVIVGRKTLADFPGGKPLNHRKNIVLSRKSNPIDGAVLVRSAEEAITAIGENERAFVIGGESVYLTLLPFIKRVFVTKMQCLPCSDAFFPNLDADPSWRIAEAGEKLVEDGVSYRFLTYVRKQEETPSVSRVNGLKNEE